jgi:predicted enzyme related to lactoylglutathione lyase
MNRPGRAVTNPPLISLSEIVLDSSDAHALASFYQRLLGGSFGKDEPDWVTLQPGDGGMTLAFATETEFVPPVWPSNPHEQQMMLHLDFEVDDLDRAVAHALAAGARLAPYQPQELVRVMIDPAGHPFCLWVTA